VCPKLPKEGFRFGIEDSFKVVFKDNQLELVEKEGVEGSEFLSDGNSVTS